MIEIKFHRLKLFFRRLYQQREAGRWLDDNAASEPSIEQQANAWLEATGNVLTCVTPTNNSLFQITEDRQLVIQSLTITYVTPMEEADVVAQYRMGQMVDPAEPKHTTSADLFVATREEGNQASLDDLGNN